jgi:hypothetical protein
MRCPAVAPWGEGCVLDVGHVGDHLTQAQRVAREEAAARWRKARDEFWAACARKARERERAKVKEVLVPIVLVPTPAQRAAGRRLVDARDDQMPAAARRLRDQIVEARLPVRATYAHALMPPKRGGEDWWDNHSVALRVQRADGTRGWGCWSNGKWDGGMWAGRLVGAREFAALCVAPVVSDVQLDSQARVLVGSGV